jgi:hypothetical protein
MGRSSAGQSATVNFAARDVANPGRDSAEGHVAEGRPGDREQSSKMNPDLRVGRGTKKRAFARRSLS